MRPDRSGGYVKPCRRGHTGGRYPSGSCIECMGLRKGQKGRKVPVDRIAAAVRTASTIGKLTREEIKLRKAKARAERQELRIKAREKKIEESKLLNVDLRRTREVAREEKRKQAPPSLRIERIPAPVEYETTTRVTADGRIIHERVIGPDGQPIKKHAEPPKAEAPTPAEPEKPKTRVEQMRADYLEHHQRPDVGAQFGFANPGGIVTHNMSREGGEDMRTSRLRLRDF